MQLKDEIAQRQMKPHWLSVAHRINNNPELLPELMQLFFSNDHATCQNASYYVHTLDDVAPNILKPYLEQMAKHLENNTNHDAVKRTILRTFQHYTFNEVLTGKIISLCFNFLTDLKEPIAIRVFAMTVIYNNCKQYPEIMNDLKVIIEDQLPYSSAGFISRGMKILKKINKV